MTTVTMGDRDIYAAIAPSLVRFATALVGPNDAAGTIVLQVVGDPEPHREALAEFGGACVIEVTRTEAEQRAIQDTIVPLLTDLPEIGIYAASSGPGGRVEIHVAVADADTARAVAALVDDPTAIRVVGMGILTP